MDDIDLYNLFNMSLIFTTLSVSNNDTNCLIVLTDHMQKAGNTTLSVGNNHYIHLQLTLQRALSFVLESQSLLFLQVIWK